MMENQPTEEKRLGLLSPSATDNRTRPSSTDNRTRPPQEGNVSRGRGSVNGDGAGESPLARVLARLEWNRSGAGYSAKCPAHDDKNPSLSITANEDGSVLVHCHTGCAPTEIVKAMGLTMADLFPRTSTARAPRMVAAYEYTDENGTLLFQSVRFDPKKFRLRRPDGNGNWTWNVKETRLVLYRLPDLVTADMVFIPEGEKDVDTLRGWGLVATCNPTGAGKWRDGYSQSLKGKHVIVLPDNDEAGEKHALQVARSLLPVAASVKLVRLPDLPAKGDVSDWRNAGHTKEELLALVEAASTWTEEAGKEEEADIAARAAAEMDGTTGEFRLTDLGNGERFVKENGRDFLYCNPWKKWLVWDGTRWKIDDAQTVRKRGRATVRGMYTAAGTLVDRMKDASDPTVKAQLFKQQTLLLRHAVQSENAKRVGAMLDLAQMDLPVMPDDFDTNLWALNVKNGTLDLRTGDLRPHMRTDLITKCVPLVYDPDAMCPQWEQFLSEIMGGNDGGNDNLVDFLWKAIGYSLTGDVREDCLFLLYGLGANGKTTFLTVLRALLADYGKQAAFSTFLHQERETVRNDLADLQGARLVVASETDEGKKLSMSVVKALTGKDMIKARFLFAEYFEYAPQMKLWLGANHKPVITGTDHAIWRRIRLIPFTQKFEGTTDDKKLGGRLKTELPGILAWAVRGCLAWQAEGLPMPEAVQVATDNYRAESDVIGAFLGECCVMEARADVLTASLYDAYTLWCKRSGEDAKTKKTFGILLQERGLENGKGSGGIRIWKGVKLASTE